MHRLSGLGIGFVIAGIGIAEFPAINLFFIAAGSIICLTLAIFGES